MEEYNPVVRNYEEEVLTGAVMAGRLERLAVERHRRDLEHGHLRGLYFDHEKGQNILDFFSILNLGPDMPFELQPWQQFELYVFYGWRRDDGRRRFRKKYKSVSRKNGKTPVESGQILYHLTVEDLYRAEAYVSATKEAQAKIAFDDAVYITDNTPELAEILEHTSTAIFNKENGSRFQYLTSNPKTADGTRPSFYVIDEYHEFDTDAMLTKLNTGTIHRKEPIANIVTTRGSRKTTPCYINEQRLYIPILEGVVQDDSTFVYIFSQDSEDEFDKPETWRKSNPMLGSVLELEKLLEEKESAVKRGQEAVIGFKTLNLNIWCDAPKSFVTDAEWMSAATPFAAETLRRKRCWAGLDASRRGDFTALCLYFPPDDWPEYDIEEVPEDFKDKIFYPRLASNVPGEHKALWWFWIPKDTVQRRVDNGLLDLRDWIEKGFVEVIEGNVIDTRIIERKIIELSEFFDIHSLAYDPYNATAIAITVDEYGIPTLELKQTTNYLCTPTRELQYLIKQKKLNNGRNPVMRWMAKNSVPYTDISGNIRIAKDDKRSPENVDGMSAFVNAVAMWMMHEYENDEPQVFFRR